MQLSIIYLFSLQTRCITKAALDQLIASNTYLFLVYTCLQDDYINARATAMENIESTIVELGSIFQELAHMVKEQEEQIQRLENGEFLLGF